MKRFLTTSAVLLALSAAASGLQAQQMITPEPMDPASPIAQRVDGVVRLLLGSDVDAAIAHVRQHATAAFTDEAIGEIVRTIMADAASHDRNYDLEAVASGMGNDVLALLRHRDGGPSLPIIFEVEASAPHRIATMRKPGLRMRAPAQ